MTCVQVLGRPNVKSTLIKVRGLKADALYRLEGTEEAYTGEELMECGFLIRDLNGDFKSRLYHFVDGQQVFCTFDHSVSRMAVLAGEITMDDIRFHSDRNKLIKVIGKSKDTVPEYGECILKPGKHAFLLCTDGFWEYVTEKEMEKTLKKASSPEKWILAMRKILAGRVDGTQDNNSAIAVFVEEEKKWKGK